MQSKIQQIVVMIVQWGLLVLLSVTLFGALQSNHLAVADLSGTLLTCLMVIFSLGLLILMNQNWRLAVKTFLERFGRWLVKHDIMVGMVCLLVVVCIQVLVIQLVQQPMTWDVKGVVDTAGSDLAAQQYRDYYSVYPNNLFLVSVLRAIRLLFGVSGEDVIARWFFFRVVNVGWIDFSAIVLFATCRKAYGSKTNLVASGLYMGLLLLSPYLQVPYSDTLVLLPITLVFWLYIQIRHQTCAWLQALCSLAIGMLIVLTMAVKPSAIVFVIAWAGIAVLRSRRSSRKQTLVTILLLMSCLIGVGGGRIAVNCVISQYSPVKIQVNRAMPWQHFVAMGMIGNGGFNANDVQEIQQIPSTAAKKEYAIKKIKQRAKGYSFRGYLKFLLIKQQLNTANGDFGWGQEGHSEPPFKKTVGRLQWLIRSLYLNEAPHQSNRSFFVQLLWVFTVIGVMGACLQRRFINDESVILVLTLIGGFLFLLLFEGGRSRYLIQYLPEIVMLAASGWTHTEVRAISCRD